ncbi:MAG: acetyltransferase [Proteobacteria bacterium]|nr:acetyltransferase [Pseudomonadota bacterium]MBU1546602.1 acetyltransferase [Pseudomonadota bacterium]MBU2620677.1 acetyltransferase [Pseudomonadota bacterium]
MKNSLILIGGGGHCKSCIDVIEQEGRFAIAGILDKTELVGARILDYPIIGTDEEIPRLVPDHYFLITVGQIKSPSTRLAIYTKLKETGARIATIVSPRAYLSSHARLGEGSIIMHGATINAGATIGNNCIINSHALVEHDAIIHDHCHIATGAIINGGVAVYEQTFIGSRVMTREYITIGAESFVAGGMNIYRDLPKQSRVTPS